ncbi:hypothetical protein E3N88_37341 [Mikania micrantha]|uniref:Nucleotide-diphospho-sugar transferase domain-containing protein n=1 Tax=Mikania micrantha TaxID=192012 RepID=A0A5N6LQS7_9ASTR|nr:hypothetical protein E3N88_37341 [Mikania micrantha]
MVNFHLKALKMGLLMVWLCGFVLISISFYASNQILPPSSIKVQIKNLSNSVGPTVIIFAAARPFIGLIGNRQSLAIRSWLGLSQDIRVILFSKDPSVFSFADSFGPDSRVSVEPNIDYTFLGTPFFHSMVARAQTSDSDISVLMDSETILFPDFISTLSYAHKLDHDWLLFALSRNILDFPFQLDVHGQHWIGNNIQRIKTEKLQEFISHGRWEQCDDKKIIMAWNNGDIPLHNGVLPPFVYGKGFHTIWVINEALSSNFRFVFDASFTISSFFVNNRDFDLKIEKGNWENVGNSHLRAFYGSLFFHEADYSNVIKIFKCSMHYHFGNTAENIIYPLGSPKGLSFNGLEVFRLSNHKKLFGCFDKIKLPGRKEGCSKKNQLMPFEPLVLPFSLELLLSMRADHNKTIVLAVAGYSYKDMLMSWACRLHNLQVSNFVVCALDDEIYDFCVLQGLPVFRDRLAPSNISFDDCHFGTGCFQRVTKVKSRVVLEILKLGYNVLMSDVDVYWFKNPLPLLTTFGPTVFVAQSDEYKITGPINLPRRLNSGFYYAHSDSTTITALNMVVKHASLSNLSEQPSFYDTLCGLNGSYRLDDDTCQEPETNLTVHFLDRNLFPNGAYLDLWDSSNVSSTCKNIGCFVLHNNWISGRQKKLERQMTSGLWEYDTSTRMCLHSWQRFKRSLFGVQSLDKKDSGNPKAVKDDSFSIGNSLKSREFCVRVVHAGGSEDLYQNPVMVTQLVKNYPGMCLAKPEVFKNPNESVLSGTDLLLPGKKYYLVPLTTLKKLKKKHAAKRNKPMEEMGHVESDDSVCSAKYYVSKEKRSRRLVKKHTESNRKLVVPVKKSKSWRGSDWEPSLTSIQELSP